MARQSKQPTGRRRPAKVAALLRKLNLPADFPLSPHFPSGQWYKTRRRRVYYFGPLDDPQGALDYYRQQQANFTAGRDLAPPGEDDRLNVATAVNAYLTAAKRRMQAGELKAFTYDRAKKVGGEIVAEFGRHRAVDDLKPGDFARLRQTFAKRFGPTELGNRIQITRSVFKYCYDSELLDKPKRFGPDFKKPARRVVRKDRASKAPRMFEAEDLRTIIDAAGVPLRAMILLGVNCGWGNTDIADLERRHVDLDAGDADYPRPKTGISREAMLWPETVAALREALDARPEPRAEADADLIFITKYGRRWVRYHPAAEGKAGSWSNGVRLQFNKLLKSLDLHEPGVSFYALRHTFQTVAEGAGDLPAVARFMGHGDESMAARYRERIDRERLEAVAEHVRGWLWPDNQ
jgi:integrase